MKPTAATADEFLSVAAEAIRLGELRLCEILEDFPTPVYTTDAEGRVTGFNAVCVEFAGRRPLLGTDLWCVTWKLYREDGSYLPHDECPMATAIKEKRPVRGLEAIAERPDGSRVHFLPFPTPLFDELGQIVGAINLLIDLTDHRQARYLNQQAERCRRLARSIDDKATATTLLNMAVEYEEKSRSLQSLN